MASVWNNTGIPHGVEQIRTENKRNMTRDSYPSRTLHLGRQIHHGTLSSPCRIPPGHFSFFEKPTNAQVHAHTQNWTSMIFNNWTVFYNFGKKLSVLRNCYVNWSVASIGKWLKYYPWWHLHLHVSLTNQLFSISDSTENITIGTRACPELVKWAWNSFTVMDGSYRPAASVCLHVAINSDWRRVLAMGEDLGQTGLVYTVQELLGTITREGEPEISWKPNMGTVKRRWTQRTRGTKSWKKKETN